MTQTDEADILRHYPLGENGMIVVASTANCGIVHAAAKGARSPKNAFYGKIDLFYKVSLTWKPPVRDGLATLTEVRLLSPRENIRREYLRTAMGAYFTKLFEKGIEPNSPIPEFHDLLDRALNYLDEKKPDFRGLAHFEREITRLHGIEHPGLTPVQSLTRFLGRLPRQRETVLKLLEEVPGE